MAQETVANLRRATGRFCTSVGVGLVTGNYRRVAEINVFRRDLYRPELIWRSFGPVEPEPGGGIYVWRRTESGQAASRTSGTDGR